MLRVHHHSCSLLLLIFTIFLSSCVNIDKTLGENLIPTDQDLTLHTATFDLPLDSRLSDSLFSNNYFIYDSEMPFLFGACYDRKFGLTEAGSVFQFFPISFFSYGDDPEPVSLTLTVWRQGNIILDEGQRTIPQNIFVHEVNTDITYPNAYNNSLKPQDWNNVPVSNPGQIYFGTDTLRIALSLDFARELLSATQEERDTIRLFLKRFKGLYLRTETPALFPNSGRINLAHDIEMTLKYTANGGDSTLTYFCGYQSLVKAFNTITHSQASLDLDPSEVIYYQGMAGYKPYINFVALTQKIQTWAQQAQIDTKKILLSRAELVLSYDSEVDYTEINKYPSALYPFTRRFTDSTSYYMPIDNIYTTSLLGAINRSKSHYSMNITSYLQSLLKKEQVTERDNAWLMEPTTYSESTSGAMIYLYNSYSYPLAAFKGTATDTKPYLKITYSILK